MKLSMWMIANRLEGLDMELDIEENAPVILNSARRAYATNCVQIYQEGEDVICNGEGNIIRINSIPVGEAFEIVQSIFDFYEDWYENISLKIEKKDYAAVANLTWQVFRNPLILFDSNNKVLGLTSRYRTDDLGPEWKYLLENGCASLNSGTDMQYPGTTYDMYYNGILCGKIAVLYKDREFNQGDFQLLDRLSRLLEPTLGQLFFENTVTSNYVFYNVLMGKKVDGARLEIQLAYQHWRMDDTYYLALVELVEHTDEHTLSDHLNLLMEVCSRRLANTVVLKKSPYLLLLSTDKLEEGEEHLHFFETLTMNNPVRIGFSLPGKGLQSAPSLFSQAKAAIEYGSAEKPDGIRFLFFDYAVDYMLLSVSLNDRVAACMPEIVELWKLYIENGDEMFYTLKGFLDNERSISKTSAVLYTHRNTVLYRIKKIQEFLGYDLDNVYVRSYCRMSIRILELWMKLQSAENPVEIREKT